MPSVICKLCTNEFYAKPSWIKNGYGKYCSTNCRSLAQKNGKIFKCHRCKNEVYRNLKDQSRSISGKFFCSKSCQTRWRNAEVNIGKNHPNWTNGVATYRDRMKRSSAEKACAKCSSKDFRVLAVHHKDKDRSNNSLSNLVWLCHNCHYLVHHHTDEAIGFMVPIA